MNRPTPLGKYLLFERIAVGGMAEVFKARAFGARGFAKIVAIKKILPHLAEDSRFVEMFIGEAKMAAQLNHTNIAQVIELGREGEDHFIAMEYISGRDVLSIHHHLRKQKQRFPIELTTYIAARIAEGLDYAHARIGQDGQPMGLVHRDISPQNVLVSHDGEVKLIDFGIAKARVRSYQATQAGVLKGKFGYMSPEQVVSQPVDGRSDVFALGTVAYELLTGKRLFFGENDFMTLEMVREAEVEAPSLSYPKIPPELDRIILRALAKDPRDRYQTAGEFGNDLMRFRHQLGASSGRKALSTWMQREFAEHLTREKSRNEAARRFSLSSDGQVIEAAPEDDEEPTALWSPIFDELEDVHDSDWDSVQGDMVAEDLDGLTPFAEPTPVPAKFASAPTPLPPPPRATVPPVDRFPDRRRKRPWLLLAGLLISAIAVGVTIQIVMSGARDNSATGVILRVTPADELTVYLDGQVVAERSPLVKAGLTPGVHRLRVERNGFATWDEAVTVSSGQLAEVNAQLAPQAAQPAQIRFEIMPPDATVEIDGKPAAPTATGYQTLPGGISVEVRLAKEGFQPRTVRFVPKPGTKEAVRYQLERLVQ